MCGIAGVFSIRHGSHEIRAAAERMQQALVHRGPDDQGVWQSSCQQAVLAHRRLSILDLSTGARQPMSTPDGRFTICFNGEIYNFRELRCELEAQGITFTTTSDTEVVLRLFERDGAACTARLRGMFAFAIWDDHTRSAFLARDPLGIKPLYIHRSAGTLVFASELRALLQCQLFTPTLNEVAVQRYLETGSVPEPLTLVHEVECVEAGHAVQWHETRCQMHRHWQFHLPATTPAHGDPVQLTREALLDSVQHHFVSDVPVGVFLSGGIDSTAILALSNAVGHKGCSTFSIAVDDVAADESPIARRTAAHFGSDHHEMRLDAKIAQELFAEFVRHLDQPTIDGFNTFTVSSFARQYGMKVVLSGLGGDELFGGYASFQQIPKMIRWHGLARLIPGITTLLQRSKPQHRRLAEFLRSPGTVQDAYASLRAIFAKAEAAKLTSWITGRPAPSVQSLTSSPQYPGSTTADQISELELTRYMRNQLLRDSDVMSMAQGLELRVPFVDQALLEAVAKIPASIRLQQGKRLLTQAVPEVPDWVVNQKKRGFLFPYQKWLGTEWSAAFNETCAGSPVPVTTWYQKWSLFVLRRCITSLNIG
jgi:asparagine synthase (glutamine-hydrolysing)